MANNSKKPEDDGVYYTPSKEARAAVSRPAPPSGKRSVPVKRKIKNEKSQIGVFLAATLFTGIIVCIVIFALLFNPLLSGGQSKSNPPAKTQTTETPAPAPDASKDVKSATGLVRSIDANGRLSVYDFLTGKILSLTADNTSKLTNKFGEQIVFPEITKGEIVDVLYDNTLITELSFSPQATEYLNISNVKIDTGEKTVEIGNETFTYNDYAVITDNADLAQIKPMDVLTVRFYKNIIWFIKLVKGHGQLTFAGFDEIIGSSVEIDNFFQSGLADYYTTDFSEGTHRVVVKGANIEPVSREIAITRNNVTVMDLSDVNIIQSRLVLHVNQPEAKVTIDGEEVNLSETVTLSYGAHKLTVEKEGFSPWAADFEVTKSVTEISVELTEKIQFCKFKITSVPEGAEIYIDSAFIGITPCTATVEYGTHTLTYKKEGYKTEEPFSITLSTPQLTEPFMLILQEDTPFMP